MDCLGKRIVQQSIALRRGLRLRDFERQFDPFVMRRLEQECRIVFVFGAFILQIPQELLADFKQIGVHCNDGRVKSP